MNDRQATHGSPATGVGWTPARPGPGDTLNGSGQAARPRQRPGRAQPPDEAFAAAVLAGLGAPRKSIPSTWLYDERGSQLFEAITDLPEYYPTRTEIGLLRDHGADIARHAGPDAVLIEIGSGSSRKTPLLLARMEHPFAYVPIDISRAFLLHSVALLRDQFPHLHILPTVADFTGPLQPPHAFHCAPARARRVVFFPGSTIGNLAPDEAVSCLTRLRELCGRRGLIVLGVDQNREETTLLPAYDDADGITAQFDLNLLARINRDLDGTFDLDAFRHESRYDRQRHRIEMHLVSQREQSVRVLGHWFHFTAGETIHTENSYKFDRADIEAMAARAGLQRIDGWSDDDDRFAIHLLAPPEAVN